MSQRSEYLDWKNWRPENFGSSSGEEQVYWSEVLRMASPRLGCACEIGFGNGGFLSFLRSNGFDCSGVEIEPELIAQARKKGFSVATELSQLPAEKKFSAIFMFDVLEHVPQESIPLLLCEINERLISGGVAVARFPNGDSPFGLKNQNGDATHVTTIGAKKMIQFAQSGNLKIDYLGAEPMPVSGGSVRTMCKKVVAKPLRNLTRRALSALLNLPIDKAFFSQNLLCIMRKSCAPTQ